MGPSRKRPKFNLSKGEGEGPTTAGTNHQPDVQATTGRPTAPATPAALPAATDASENVIHNVIPSGSPSVMAGVDGGTAEQVSYGSSSSFTCLG